MARVPRATYRVQLTPAFDLHAARAVVDYVHALGVSHLYVSPVLEAVRGSQHGYDVVDHARVRAELGGEAAFDALCTALRERGMGLLLDIVPNHMAIGTSDNKLWWDVLENGPASDYASFFDVDWDSAADNRVLLPVLGERYGDALEQGLLRVERSDARFVVRYREHAFPCAPRSLGEILSRAAEAALQRGAGEGGHELAFIGEALGQLPHAWTVDRKGATRRQRDKDVLYAHLERLIREQPELDAAIAHETAALSGDYDRLDAWLERQNWRVAFWKAAATELGYRRFFDVQTLAGLRVEDPAVFDATHACFIEWARAGKVSGLRVDHPDGLRDPEGYLHRLRAAAPDSYIVVEKILDAGEQLRSSWPVDGTTGYDFMRLLDQVQVDPSGEAALSELGDRMRGEPQAWSELARLAKHEILERVLASERERVVQLAYAALSSMRSLRDVTRAELRVALSHVLASYDGYRSYVRQDAPLDPLDRAAITGALSRAQRHHAEADERLWQGLEAALTLQPPCEHAASFALAMQQLSSAVAAKAVEDTACYRYLRLSALNEVGGSPGTFGISREAFHAALGARAGDASLLATATHDTKRGEDVRARLLVLSELAEPWAAEVAGWLERSSAHGDRALDDGARYLFLQTLVGAFPLQLERANAYMLKAVREAKLHTSWIAPDTPYEAALGRYVSAVLADSELMHDIERFARRLAEHGYVASLARTLIKLTAPGVPDLYQGSELWDLSLVDPDNRRPVDFAIRQALLTHVEALTPEAAIQDIEAGTPKLWLTARALRLRARAPELFEGAYEPLETHGDGQEAVLAYARAGELLVVVPRWPARAARLTPEARVRLPEGHFRSVLTGAAVAARDGNVSVLDLWSRFPVALLARER
jgi:(1->4)-alpha-D-glucan 1-alpha-D-glucosylmutase